MRITKSGIGWSLLGILTCVLILSNWRELAFSVFPLVNWTEFSFSEHFSNNELLRKTLRYEMYVFIALIAFILVSYGPVMLLRKRTTTPMVCPGMILEEKHRRTARLIVDYNGNSATALERKYSRGMFVFGLDEDPMAAAFKLKPGTRIHSPFMGTAKSLSHISGETSLLIIWEYGTQNYLWIEYTGERQIPTQENVGLGYVRKGDVLATTGALNLGVGFDSCNLLLFFEKNGTWDNARVKEMFGT